MSHALDSDNESEDNSNNNVKPVVDENGAAAGAENGDATASGLDQDENSGMTHPKMKVLEFWKIVF